MLSFIFRLLARARKRGKATDELTQDMFGTFEEARQEARQRGWWSYLRFGAREIAGLLGSPPRRSPRRRWLGIVASGIAGTLVGIGVYYLVPASYTSEAMLQVVPARIPEALTGVDDSYLNPSIPAIRQVILSRVALTTIIRNFDLYPRKLARHPMEDVVNDMRKAIRMEAVGESGILVKFTYTDYPSSGGGRLVAQRVVQELVTRLIDENTRSQNAMAYEAEQFFEDRSNKIGKTWEALNTQLRGMSSTDSRYARLALDRDLAREQYESVRRKLGAAQGLYELAGRKQTRTLALLDPPSLPFRPNVTQEQTGLAGLAAGLALGLLVSLWRSLRGASANLPEPEAARG